MNIGIDIDGVLTDIQSYNMKHAPAFFLKKFGKEVKDAGKYDIRDIFDCSQEELIAYWKKYLLRYAVTEPAYKNAKKVIRKFRKSGHKIYIITKRVFTCQNDFLGKLMRFIVRNWLWRNGIRYDEIVFCDNDIPDSKGTACRTKNIDIMIDDEIVNIEAIAPVAKVICFDATYNHGYEHDNVIRAYNWDEIYTLINKTGEV